MMSLPRAVVILVSVLGLTVGPAAAATGQAVQARLDTDIADARPVVVHVVVALCDNVHQGIVPVSEALGNGQDPKTNLYWGALYGLRTYMPGSGNWHKVGASRPDDHRILDRIVLYAEIERNGRSVPVYVVADAWDGARIRDAIRAYLEMAAGRSVEQVTPGEGTSRVSLQAGGASHLVVYVGHDGLMDFEVPQAAPAETASAPRSAVVLACESKSYFQGRLRRVGAHPLLLTTGLMAPESYTLDATIRSWVRAGTTAAVIDSAARAYDRYQKCGLPAARRLFWGEP